MKGCGNSAGLGNCAEPSAAYRRSPSTVCRRCQVRIPHGGDEKLKPEHRMVTAQRWFSHAARALEHCGCGQAQRSFRPLPSPASAQAWLQYFSPADTGQLHCGLAQRSSIAASAMKASSCHSVERSISRTPFDAWRRREEGLDLPDTHFALRT